MSIEKRGTSWRARYRGPDGRERNKSFGRKIDAQRWQHEQQSRINRGEWVDPSVSRTPFGVVADEWLATIHHLKPTTRYSYEFVLRRRVLPTWARVPLSKITHDGLVQWVTALVESGLSASQVHQAAYVLSSVCKYAIRTARLTRNPMADVRLPRLRSERERRFLTHDEVAKLAAAAGTYASLIRLLAYTGLRWGEAAALRVGDIDLVRRRLDVVRAFTDVRGRMIEGSPKSHQSRTVPLHRWLCSELAPYVEGRDRDALVFTAPGGGPLRKSNFRHRVWYPAVRAAGLDGLTPHELRHTAASLYIAAGTPPKVVQRILGHASITITLDLYGHLYPDEMDQWADRLGEIAATVWPERGQIRDTGDDEPPSEAGAKP
ncbi:tyrosine-type recombinase/integrase [Phytoactinopolyspora halotolerans]|uniref:Site-specific integrase n=1 Tax=Phytoactinopolyspora halotolerans TaxID=1981512 RepID=A0A6L9SAK9_9ACTN|nr:site-specific integrase [Phytoactinopolyspora halotolerans]NEE02073.1 site-specific integrase [Phytoactinopolyspora halotolerans]